MIRDKYNKMIAEKLGVPVGKPKPEKPVEKIRTDLDWCKDMAGDIKAMGHPYSRGSILFVLLGAVKWAKSHPNKEEVYDRVNIRNINRGEVDFNVLPPNI